MSLVSVANGEMSLTSLVAEVEVGQIDDVAPIPERSAILS